MWFGEEDTFPILITKVLDQQIKFKDIRHSISIQEKIDKEMGHAVFPAIFDTVQMDGHIVLFQEGIKGLTFERELLDAIYGPEPSLTNLEQIIQRQFDEMGKLFRHLRNIRILGTPQKWGEWAYKVGQDFRDTCGFDVDFLTDMHLIKIREAINSVPLYEHVVPQELHPANIFPGPKLIDQIQLCASENITQPSRPAVIQLLSFIIKYFLSGPIRRVFKDWVDALACALMDRSNRTIICHPVRGLLKDLGLNPKKADVTWAFIVVTSLLEMKHSLKGYRDSGDMLRKLKVEFYQWTANLVKILDLISEGKEFDSTPVILAQNTAFEGATTIKEELPLLNKSKIKTVAIFGTSSAAQKILKYLEGIGVKISFLVDNNPAKWGRSSNGYRIYPPTELIYRRQDYDICIIASHWKDSIAEQLNAMKLTKGRDFI
jgi:hypothetical protein